MPESNAAQISHSRRSGTGQTQTLIAPGAVLLPVASGEIAVPTSGAPNHNRQSIPLLQARLNLKLNRVFRRACAPQAQRSEQLTEETPNGKIEPGN